MLPTPLRYYRTILLLLLSALNAVSLSAQCGNQRYVDPIFPQVARTEDLWYANADPYGLFGGQNLYLDLYEPVGDTLAARPVIVYLHGSGFLVGDKRQPPIPDWAEYYARRGYVVVSVGYRLGFNVSSGASAERAVFRGVQDLRAALRMLAEYRQGFRLSLDHFFTAGSSAGCFAGLHSAFMQEADRPGSTYGILLEPSDLGCGDCSGNQYLGNQPVPVRGIVNYWGAIGDTNWIDANERVPVLSVHGTSDAVVPFAQGYPFSLPIFPTVQGSLLIHRRLTHLGIPSQLVSLYGAGHEPELTNGDYLDTMYQVTTPFLFELVRPQTPPITGPESLCAGSSATYTVGPTSNGSSYCWTVTGGILLSQNGSSITVQWPDQPGTGTLSVVEVNSLGADGETRTFDVTVHPIPSLNLDTLATVSCYGGADGGLIALSTGMGAGTGFWWGGGQTDALLDSLPAGIYTVTTTNTFGCWAADTAVLDEPTALVLSLSALPSTGSDGAAFATVAGGTPPYAWVWDTGAQTDSLSQLPPGVYGLTITDANGCSAIDSVQVDSLPVTGLSESPVSEASAWVFPNPGTGAVTLRVEHFGAERIGLFDLQGRSLGFWPWTSAAQSLSLDLSHLPAGMYCWVVFDAAGRTQALVWEKR
jgi:acetyl esterase/lipase